MDARRRRSGRVGPGSAPAGIGVGERALLQSLLRDSGDVIAAIGLDRRYLVVNEAYARAFQHAGGGEPAVGMKLDDAAARLPERQAEVLGAWEQALAGARFTIERIVGEGEGQRVYEVTFGPLRNPAGALIGAFLVGRDISKRHRALAALRASEERFRALAEATREGVAIHDGKAIVEANVAFLDLFGYTRAEILGRDPRDVIAPEAQADAVARAGRGYAEAYESMGLRKDGTIFPVEFCGKPVTYQGRPMRVGLVRDLTAVKAAEAALREREERLRLALDAAELAEWDLDLLTGAFACSPRFNELNGFAPDHRPTLDEVRARYHPDDAAVIARRRDEAFGSPDLRLGEYDYRVVLPDGRVRWLRARGEGRRDAKGRLARAVGVLMDVTARKEAEAHEALLVAELNHRAKNLLATVQAVIAGSRRQAGSVAEYAETVLGRVRALAHAHELLAADRWKGASLKELLRTELAAYGLDEGRVALAGEDVRLDRRMAQVLSLAVHELATNAAKHGALSAPGGWVALEAKLQAGAGSRWLRLSWRETGGPPVAPPLTRGFGSTLIERSIGYELRGQAALEFAPEGLRCEIAVPLGGTARDGRDPPA